SYTYPYGASSPPPGQANDLPYPVISNPKAYYPYISKEGKKVYAALAPFGLRVGAALLDTIVVYLPLAFLITFIYFATLSPVEIENLNTLLTSDDLSKISGATPNWVNLLSGTLYLSYVTLMHWLFKGQTLGKRLLGIKVIHLDGTRLNFNTALLRSVFGFSSMLGGIIAPYGALFYLISLGLTLMVMWGFASIISDKYRRGWHDKLAETIEVRSIELVQGINY
ncbi:MAG: RDD family protein, partial [Chloroflexota bacterium]